MNNSEMKISSSCEKIRSGLFYEYAKKETAQTRP